MIVIALSILILVALPASNCKRRLPGTYPHDDVSTLTVCAVLSWSHFFPGFLPASAGCRRLRDWLEPGFWVGLMKLAPAGPEFFLMCSKGAVAAGRSVSVYPVRRSSKLAGWLLCTTSAVSCTAHSVIMGIPLMITWHHSGYTPGRGASQNRGVLYDPRHIEITARSIRRLKDAIGSIFGQPPMAHALLA